MDQSHFDEAFGRQKIKDGYEKAKKILNDEDQMEEFLRELEKKLSEVPKIGKKLKNIPVLVSLVKSYVKKEYTDIPVGSIIAVISALLYFVSPWDIIPDSIPGIGYVDDTTVILVCCKLIETDLIKYSKWRDEHFSA